MKRAPRLRSISVMMSIALVIAALAAGAAALLLASWLDTTADLLEVALEDVAYARGVNEALERYRYWSLNEIELGTTGEGEREALREGVRRAVAEIEADHPVEQRQLEQVQETIENFIALATEVERTSTNPQDVAIATHRAYVDAHAEVGRLVDTQLANAAAIEQRAQGYGRKALALALSFGVLLPLTVAIALVAFVRMIERPLQTLCAAMKRFLSGEMSVRAPEIGPAELRDSARQFNELADAAMSQRRARTAAIGGVAHDLRNPLSALRMSTQLLDRADLCANPERLKRHIGVVARQVDRLERMLSDLVDVARIDAGQLRLDVGRHDVAAITRGVAEMYERASPNHQILLAVPREPVFVECDDVRVEQILINLVSNAIKYSPEGGAIGISLRPGAESVELSVSDEGVGIAREDLTRLFEPFTRLKLADQNIPGAGLGLAVVRQLVALHRGRIDVTSAPKEGSTFRVVLPRRLDAAASASPRDREVEAAPPPA